MAKQRLTARQLEAFVVVAETNSFTAAAQRLSLTTSAISSLISELEISVGARLFERSTRRVSVTEAGRQFLPAAIGVQRNLRQAEFVAQSLSAQSAGMVRIAAPMVIASVILPPIISAFQAETTGIEISIIDTGVEWLADRVSTGEADLAIGPDRTTDETVSAENLAPTHWVVWLSPDHPLSAKPVLQWRDLKGTRFHAAGHDHDRIFAQAMAGLAEEDRIIPGQVFDNISTALGVAAANLGVTLCPAYVEPLASAFRLEMRRVIDPEFTRYIALYSPAQRQIAPPTLKFADMLRRHFLTDKV